MNIYEYMQTQYVGTQIAVIVLHDRDWRHFMSKALDHTPHGTVFMNTRRRIVYPNSTTLHFFHADNPEALMGRRFDLVLYDDRLPQETHGRETLALLEDMQVRHKNLLQACNIYDLADGTVQIAMQQQEDPTP